MTRREAETAIISKLEEIVAIYREYNPDGSYLAMAFQDDDGDHWIHVNNDYYNHADKPIYMSVKGDKIYDAVPD